MNCRLFLFFFTLPPSNLQLPVKDETAPMGVINSDSKPGQDSNKHKHQCNNSVRGLHLGNLHSSADAFPSRIPKEFVLAKQHFEKLRTSPDLQHQCKLLQGGDLTNLQAAHSHRKTEIAAIITKCAQQKLIIPSFNLLY